MATRRDFIKTGVGAGIGALLGQACSKSSNRTVDNLVSDANSGWLKGIPGSEYPLKYLPEGLLEYFKTNVDSFNSRITAKLNSDEFNKDENRTTHTKRSYKLYLDGKEIGELTFKSHRWDYPAFEGIIQDTLRHEQSYHYLGFLPEPGTNGKSLVKAEATARYIFDRFLLNYSTKGWVNTGSIELMPNK